MGARSDLTVLARLPDFIGVGPPRTATTWLHQVLTGHVGFPQERKETDFFSRFYDRGLDWYLDYFRNCPPNLPMGEFSPMYFMSDEARDRIRRDIPNAKIICSFRDPVARVESQWRLMVRSVWTRLELVPAVEAHRELRESARYGHYLEKWLNDFGTDRVLILFHEDLERDPQMFVDRACDFIGAARFDVANSPVAGKRIHGVPQRPKNLRLARRARKLMSWLNERRYHRIAKSIRSGPIWRFCLERGAPFGPIDPHDDAILRERMRPEIEHLERLTGRDLTVWKTPRA